MKIRFVALDFDGLAESGHGVGMVALGCKRLPT
jgi:hypothetical protein